MAASTVPMAPMAGTMPRPSSRSLSSTIARSLVADNGSTVQDNNGNAISHDFAQLHALIKSNGSVLFPMYSPEQLDIISGLHRTAACRMMQVALVGRRTVSARTDTGRMVETKVLKIAKIDTAQQMRADPRRPNVMYAEKQLPEWFLLSRARAKATYALLCTLEGMIGEMDLGDLHIRSVAGEGEDENAADALPRYEETWE